MRSIPWRHGAIVAGIVIAGAALSACGPAIISGAAVPTGQGGGQTGSAPAGRPKSISLTGRNPCTIIPSSAMSGLKVSGPGTPSMIVGAPSCQYPTAAGSSSIGLDTEEGIDFWLSQTHDGKASDLPPIRGYRTIRVTTSGEEASTCTAYLDIADGQELKGFTLADDPAKTPPCQESEHFLDAAMASLLAHS